MRVYFSRLLAAGAAMGAFGSLAKAKLLVAFELFCFLLAALHKLISEFLGSMTKERLNLVLQVSLAR
jgi:hypothetical protein